MGHWLLKAAVQGVLSLLPRSQSWNRVLQQHVTRSLRLDPPRFELTLQQCRAHWSALSENCGPQGVPVTVFEIGTGWYPTLPIAFYLSGASRVWTADTASLLVPARVQDTARLFLHYADQGALATLLPCYSDSRLAALRDLLTASVSTSPAALLEPLAITPLVGTALWHTVPPHSISLFVSNSTLEHIPADTLTTIFNDFRGLAAPGALQSHFIDMSDHYSHFDSRLCPLHFLRYSDAIWRLFNNSLHYQNRLRISDYRRIHREAGLTIVAEQIQKAPVDGIPPDEVAGCFNRYSLDDLSTTHCWLVSTEGMLVEQAAGNPGCCAPNDARDGLLASQKSSTTASFRTRQPSSSVFEQEVERPALVDSGRQG